MSPDARTPLDASVARLGEVVTATEPVLTALDAASGDGDFGANVDDGLTRVARIVADDATAAPWTTLRTVFLDEVGGTSGPLFGLLFQALDRAADDAATYPRALADGLRAGLEAIQRVGEAEVGDCTLVDALAPAVQAMGDGDVAAMVTAAVDGAVATAALRARRGRASYVGDRAVGTADPGAVGLALVLAVLAEPEVGPDAAAAERTRLLEAVAP